MKTYIVTFLNYFDAMTYSSAVKPLGKVKLRPVPRTLSSSCGTCVFFTPKEDISLEGLTASPCDAVYLAEGNDFSLLYQSHQ